MVAIRELPTRCGIRPVGRGCARMCALGYRARTARLRPLEYGL